MSEINPQFTENKQNEYMVLRGARMMLSLWIRLYLGGGGWENTVLHTKKC